MSPDMLSAIVLVLIGSIGVGVYKYMAKKSEMVAHHELGHALVAAYYGAKVYEIAIGSIDSGGVTRTGDLTDATKYPSVIAAGYVAEEMYKGRYPTGHMNEVQYYHDRRMLLDATGSDMGKVDDAVRDAYRILSSDEMKSSMKVMVPRLVKTGRIVFDSEV